MFSTKCLCANNEWSERAPSAQLERQEVSVLHITAIFTLSHIITLILLEKHWVFQSKLKMYPFTTHTDGNKGSGDIFKALNHVTILEFYRGKEFVCRYCESSWPKHWQVIYTTSRHMMTPHEQYRDLFRCVVFCFSVVFLHWHNSKFLFMAMTEIVQLWWIVKVSPLTCWWAENRSIINYPSLVLK